MSRNWNQLIRLFFDFIGLFTALTNDEICEKLIKNLMNEYNQE